MIYHRMNKLEAHQISYHLQQNLSNLAILLLWSLNLHSTSGTQVSLSLELEWLGSYMQRTSNHETELASGVMQQIECELC